MAVQRRASPVSLGLPELLARLERSESLGRKAR
jgi:hypothetical protein